MAEDKTPFILGEKTKDMVGYLYDVMAHAPKYEKFTTQTQAKNLALEFALLVDKAGKSTRCKAVLFEADLKLDGLRLIIDIMRDRNYISLHRYETLTRHINECGRLLGSWIKAEIERSK